MISENKKKTVPDTYYVKNDYTKVIKVYKDYVRFRTRRNHKKRRKTKKTRFLKELVENTGLYKSVLNKLIFTQE